MYQPTNVLTNTSLAIVIELDGDIHNQQVEYDAARTEYLNQLGYRVIRFRNPDVMCIT